MKTLHIGHKLLIIGGIMAAYWPISILLTVFFNTQILIQQTTTETESGNTVSGSLIPHQEFLIFSGFALLIIGASYTFFKRIRK